MRSSMEHRCWALPWISPVMEPPCLALVWHGLLTSCGGWLRLRGHSYGGREYRDHADSRRKHRRPRRRLRKNTAPSLRDLGPWPQRGLGQEFFFSRSFKAIRQESLSLIANYRWLCDCTYMDSLDYRDVILARALVFPKMGEGRDSALLVLKDTLCQKLQEALSHFLMKIGLEKK